jgi:uncharacterized protein (DUF885 family)
LFRFATGPATQIALARETYPGQLLQLSVARGNPSRVRRAQRASSSLAGWSLYVAQYIVDHGWIPDHSGVSREYWQAIRLAAAQAITDARLHTGVFNFDQAERFLSRYDTKNPLVTEEESRRQSADAVVQILQHPAQAPAALLGKQALDRLAARARDGAGSAFSPRQFHDRLLAEGAIPPTYLATILFHDPLPPLEPFVDTSFRAPATASDGDTPY